MTQQQKNSILTVAKGSNQKWLLSQLLDGRKVSFSAYCGYCTYNYNSNKQSFYNLVNRLEQLGLTVNIQKGNHGGMWSAYISLSL
jgi:hypothetical protein